MYAQRRSAPLSGSMLILVVACWPGWVHGEVPATEQGDLRCEAVYHESGIEAFGQAFSVRTGQEVTLPDFRLRVMASTGATRTLQLKRADGMKHIVVVPERRADTDPHEFELAGQRYVVEINRSVSEFRALASDELVVWPHEEYRAAHNKQDIR